jgi:alpha-glucosidase (family GH31 glycosyl hydrolase)
VNYPLPAVQAFTKQLHSNGQRYVPIVDPGIRNEDGYASWDEGLAADIFIKNGPGGADSGKPYIGEVWPGSTAFPDFLHVNGSAYWKSQIAAFLDQVPYDGLWIDMNELSNFQNGGMSDPNNPVNTPPYAINNFGNKASLDTKTLPMDATHGEKQQYREYDVHNLYGLAEAVSTRAALESIKGERSFILTRSTFPGSGAHVAHWLGDNHATWDDMWRSIPGVLNSNMYGIPMVGSDICGFIGTTTEELCGRWTALGAWYTFTRNHHEPGADQEPFQWPSVEAIAKRVLAMRYTLLPHLYTIMNDVHVNGGTVLRSLMFNFPTDKNTYAVDAQFMWGSSLLITPVVTEGASSVTGYFPSDSQWYDLWTLEKLPQAGTQTLECTFDQGVRVHVAGGNILPTQQPALTTVQSRRNPFGLVVALCGCGKAKGKLFWDSGADLVDGANSLSVAFNATGVSGGGVQWTVQSNTFKGTLPPLQSISVAGMPFAPRSISLNGVALPANTFQFDAGRNVLTVTSLNARLNANSLLTWQQ